MIVKVLRHKKMPDTYGHVIHMRDAVFIWPTNIPDLFPTTATVESLRELHKNRKGDWEEELDNYSMVEAQVVTKL